jgi:hypothetical protein
LPLSASPICMSSSISLKQPSCWATRKATFVAHTAHVSSSGLARAPRAPLPDGFSCAATIVCILSYSFRAVKTRRSSTAHRCQGVPSVAMSPRDMACRRGRTPDASGPAGDGGDLVLETHGTSSRFAGRLRPKRCGRERSWDPADHRRRGHEGRIPSSRWPPAARHAPIRRPVHRP